MRLFVSKGAHGTAAIEGNTLSEEEVAARAAGELPLPESQEYLGVEIDNIIGAYNSITQEAFVDDCFGPLTVDKIKDFHRSILTGQPLQEGVVPGEFRDGSVVVGNYRGAPAEDCEHLMERLVEWLYTGFTPPADQEALTVPLKIARAIVAHLYIAWIHPFGDGNGRVARLVEFALLVEAGVPLPACHVLSSHYNRTRAAYYNALDQTSRRSGYPWEFFVEYALKGFQEQLKDELTTIRSHQMEVTWENYIHETFHDRDGLTARRQRKLVLDLPPDRAVPRPDVRLVSPRVAEEYAGKTLKTVSRDLNVLRELGLIRFVRGGVEANRGVISAFLPPHTTDEDGHNDLLADLLDA